jgi:anti-sigma factor RsiW
MVDKVDNPMSGQTRWSRSSARMEHPDESILLASTRGQALDEGWSSIHHHLDTCQECYQRSLKYAKLSRELSETLEHFQRNQDYPPLAECVFELIDNPTAVRLARRQREQERRKGGKRVSLVSVRPVLAPVAALLLLLLFAAIVLAYGADWSYLDPSLLPQSQNGTGIPSIATVASHPSQSATKQAVGTVGATERANRKPTIRLCTTHADKAQSRMRVCGANFPTGDKVQLVVHLASGGARTRHPVLVDAQGRFQDAWVVAKCKDVPIAIDVQDETASTEVSWQLQGGHQLGHCSVPDPMSSVGS